MTRLFSLRFFVREGTKTGQDLFKSQKPLSDILRKKIYLAECYFLSTEKRKDATETTFRNTHHNKTLLMMKLHNKNCLQFATELFNKSVKYLENIVWSNEAITEPLEFHCIHHV